MYSAANGELERAIEHRHTVESLGFSPDGTQLGAGQGVYGVRLSKVIDGEEIQTLGSGYNSVVAYSPDGETVASGNRDGIIWLWRLADGELLASFERPEAGSPTDRWMKALVFSPDGALMASAHWDGRIHVWQVSSGDILHTLEAPEGPSGTGTIAFSPDGSLLAVNGAREDGSHGVRLWQVSDGKPLRVLTGHANETTDVAFSPDGTLLVSGGSTRDGTVKLWQTSDWSLWHSLEHLDAQGKIDWITTVAFSPDGKNLVVGTQSGLIWFWQVQP